MFADCFPRYKLNAVVSFFGISCVVNKDYFFNNSVSMSVLCDVMTPSVGRSSNNVYT